MKIPRFSLIIVIILLIGCANTQAQSIREMNELGSALTKLSSAVESTVRYKGIGADLPDDELLILSTKHDPGLLEPFQGYKLHVLRQNGHTAVLVCTEDGLAALLEDAGCTARMDQHRWKAQPLSPCEFTLDLSKVCTSPK
ncbi:MAG: hypothetical protein WCJ37_06105 [Syntrophus sp. (in: bacteria)]